MFGKDYVMTVNTRLLKNQKLLDSSLVHELQHYLDYLHNPDIFNFEQIEKTSEEMSKALKQSEANDRKAYFLTEGFHRRPDSTAADITKFVPSANAPQVRPMVQAAFQQAFQNQRRRYISYDTQPAEAHAEKVRCLYLRFIGVSAGEFLAEDSNYSDVHRHEIGYYNILDVPLPSGEIHYAKSPLISQLVDCYRPCFE